MLRNIAKSGLKGRPRETKILLVALSLAFFFVTISLILLATSNVNRAIQRQSTYGKWDGVYIRDTKQTAETLRQTGLTIGQTRLIGQDNRLGLIATADDTFWDLANIKLLSGRLSEALDEIVLEQGQLSHFAETPKVGDKVRVTFKVKYSEVSEDEVGFEILPFAQSIKDHFIRAVAEHWEIMPERVNHFFDGELKNAESYAQSSYEFFQQNPQFNTNNPSYDDILKNTIARIEEARANRLVVYAKDPGTIEQRMMRIKQRQVEEFEENVRSYLNNADLRDQYGTTPEDQEKNIREMLDPEKMMIDAVRNESHLAKASELEGFSGTTIQSRHNILTINSRADFHSLRWDAWLLNDDELPKLQIESETVLNQEVSLIRDLTLTGIIEDYHQMWDGPTAQYPNAFITPETGTRLIEEGLHLSKVAQNQSYIPPIHLFVQGETVGDTPENFFLNQLAQEQTGISEAQISRILLLTLGLITAFSIFQISLVQLKKRQRKFALMRSIGATISQIKTIMTWEALYLLGLALPVGVLSGVVMSWVLVWLNNLLTGDEIRLVIQGGWFVAGIASTLISGLIGLFFPLRRLERIPLRGSVAITDQKANRKTRDVIGEKAIERQSLSSINRRHHRFIRKQRMITGLLFSLILLIVLSGLTLIYLSFQDYREQVIASDMPDFEFVRGYQQSNQFNRQLMDELKKIERLKRIDLLNKGERAYLYYPGVQQNELTNYFLKLLPGDLGYDYYGTQTNYVVPETEKHLTKNALVVDVFGVESDSPLGERLKTIVPSDFDWDEFILGDSIILLSPGYSIQEKQPSPVEIDVANKFERNERIKEIFNLTGVANISYDGRRSATLKTEPTLAGLERVLLTIPTGDVLTDDQVATNTVITHDLPIGAILHELPEQGLWPISYTKQNPVVLISKFHLERLYPHRMSQGVQLQFTSFGRTQRSERYGNTLMHVYLDKPTEEEALEIKRLGFDYNFKVNGLYLVKERIYAKGFQTSLIIGLLCIALLIIALQIQTTSYRGLLETERARIGILQSLGVRAKDYSQTYLVDAIKQVGLSVLITHAVLAVVITLYLLIVSPGSNLLLELKIQLADYPLVIHGLIVLGFMLLSIAAAYWPLGAILKRRPVENIRSLQ